MARSHRITLSRHVEQGSLAVAVLLACAAADMALLGHHHPSGRYSLAVLAVTGLGLGSAVWGACRARTRMASAVVAVTGTVILVTGFAAAYLGLDEGSFLPALDMPSSFQLTLRILGSGQPGDTLVVTRHASTLLDLQRLVDMLYVFTAVGVIIVRSVRADRSGRSRS